MLTLTKDYRIIGRDLNFVLEHKQIIKEHVMTNIFSFIIINMFSIPTEYTSWFIFL